VGCFLILLFTAFLQPDYEQTQRSSTSYHTLSLRSAFVCSQSQDTPCKHSVVVVQVTFLTAASTPKEIKLLHAPTLASAFRLLPVQATISAQNAGRCLQHTVSVSSNIPVLRFLKVEMTGLAVDNVAGRLVWEHSQHDCRTENSVDSLSSTGVDLTSAWLPPQQAWPLCTRWPLLQHVDTPPRPLRTA
jgi:hypothetical protein